MNKIKFISLLIIVGYLFSSDLPLMTLDEIKDNKSSFSDTKNNRLLFHILQNDKKLNKIPFFSCLYKDIVKTSDQELKIHETNYSYPESIYSLTDSDDFSDNELVDVYFLFNTILSIQKNASNQFVLNKSSVKSMIDTDNFTDRSLRDLKGQRLIAIDKDIIPKDLGSKNKLSINTGEAVGPVLPDWLNWRNGSIFGATILTVATIYNINNFQQSYYIYQESTDTQVVDYHKEQSQNQLTYGIAFGIGSLGLWSYTIYDFIKN
tara:strand:- start:979 stop:1767 length:789 start_codon:yes stop_codon:yes gene_type:complete